MSKTTDHLSEWNKSIWTKLLMERADKLEEENTKLKQENADGRDAFDTVAKENERLKNAYMINDPNKIGTPLFVDRNGNKGNPGSLVDRAAKSLENITLKINLEAADARIKALTEMLDKTDPPTGWVQGVDENGNPVYARESELKWISKPTTPLEDLEKATETARGNTNVIAPGVVTENEAIAVLETRIKQLTEMLETEERTATESGGILSNVCNILFEDDERALEHGYEGVEDQARDLIQDRDSARRSLGEAESELERVKGERDDARRERDYVWADRKAVREQRYKAETELASIKAGNEAAARLAGELFYERRCELIKDDAPRDMVVNSFAAMFNRALSELTPDKAPEPNNKAEPCEDCGRSNCKVHNPRTPCGDWLPKGAPEPNGECEVCGEPAKYCSERCASDATPHPAPELNCRDCADDGCTYCGKDSINNQIGIRISLLNCFKPEPTIKVNDLTEDWQAARQKIAHIKKQCEEFATEFLRAGVERGELRRQNARHSQQVSELFRQTEGLTSNVKSCQECAGGDYKQAMLRIDDIEERAKALEDWTNGESYALHGNQIKALNDRLEEYEKLAKKLKTVLELEQDAKDMGGE